MHVYLPSDAEKCVQTSRHRFERKPATLGLENYIRRFDLNCLESDTLWEEASKDLLKSSENLNILSICLNRSVAFAKDSKAIRASFIATEGLRCGCSP